MHNCVVEYDGIEYVSARAIPYVTGGFISPFNVPNLLAGIDIDFSARSYRLSNGSAELVDEDEWLAVTKPTTYEDIPAGVLVKLDDLKSVIFSCYCEPLLPLDLQDSIPPSVFRIPIKGELLSDEIFKKIMEGIKPQPKSRKDSTINTCAKIQTAVDKIKEICLNANVSFSIDEVPGQKRQMLECIKLLDSSITIAEATFGNNGYAEKLGLKWKKGARPQKGEKMVAAVKRYLGGNP